MSQQLTTGSPFLHDRWDDQVTLEEEMLVEGKQRMKDRINKALLRRDMNGMKPHRSLLIEWVVLLSPTL